MKKVLLFTALAAALAAGLLGGRWRLLLVSYLLFNRRSG